MRGAFTYPELFGLSFFVVLEFIHILLKLLYVSLRSCLLFLCYLHNFLEILDSIFSRFNVVSDCMLWIKREN